jgi:hypothetical protein
MLAEDLTVICGEDPQTNPQGKLHSDIVEANGWLFMSTHFSSELPGAYDTWTGAHVIGYHLATGQFRDYGVVHPNYTSYSGIAVDPSRNYLYVLVTGQKTGQVTYLYRIHTISGEKLNLGHVGVNFHASFYMFVDRRGDVWFSMADRNGELRRLRADTLQIEVFSNVLPPLLRWDADQVNSNTTEQSRRWILWMQRLDEDRAVFTMANDGGGLYIFDSTKPVANGEAFQKIKHIGFSDLGLAVGNNRVYYYQRANRGYGEQEATDFHLLSVSLDPATAYEIVDHGLLRDQDGRLVWRVPGMASDGGNRVFMIGDWWTMPEDLGTLRYRYSGGVESYVQLPRGEFFAVADVSFPEVPGLAGVNLSTSWAFVAMSLPGNSVRLGGPVAANTVVTLSSSNTTAASVPATVTVPAGASTASFDIKTGAVGSITTVTVRATLNGITETAAFKVYPKPLVSSLVLSPTSVPAGTSTTTNYVSVSHAAPPGGLVVNLSSANQAAASPPDSIIVPEGTLRSANFTINTGLPSANTAASITAKYGASTRSATLTLTVTIPYLALSPASLNAGSAGTLNRVTLSRPAPAGGALVALSSSNPAAASVPGSVLIAAGSTASPYFRTDTFPVASTTAVSISASYKNVARAATLTVYPVTLYSVILSPTAPKGGTSSTAHRVTLTRAAPPGGATVMLTSSNPAIAIVPPSVLVAAGRTTAYFQIQTNQVTQKTLVQIGAAFGGVSKTVQLTVMP